MSKNALPILLLGGAALAALAGKKAKPTAKPIPTAPEGTPFNPQSYVNIAFDTNPEYVFLGNGAVVAKVSGVDAQGFVYPLENETLGTWLTRVAYWGAYPQNKNVPKFAGAPFEIPPQCMSPELAKKLGAYCDPAFLPWRDALLQVHGLVVAEAQKRGVDLSIKAKSVYEV